MVYIITGIGAESSTAMTGCITLGGRVTPVEGLEPKLLAAAMDATITRVLVPREDAARAAIIYASLSLKLEVIGVSTVMEMVELVHGGQSRK
jgi:ATP-dependent Lon protease